MNGDPLYESWIVVYWTGTAALYTNPAWLYCPGHSPGAVSVPEELINYAGSRWKQEDDCLWCLGTLAINREINVQLQPCSLANTHRMENIYIYIRMERFSFWNSIIPGGGQDLWGQTFVKKEKDILFYRSGNRLFSFILLSYVISWPHFPVPPFLLVSSPTPPPINSSSGNRFFWEGQRISSKYITWKNNLKTLKKSNKLLNLFSLIG